MKKFLLALVVTTSFTAACGSASKSQDGAIAPTTATTSTTVPAPTTTTTVYVAPTTTTVYVAPTTTTVDRDAVKAAFTDQCYGALWEGEKKLSDNAVALAKIGGAANIKAARDAVVVMRQSAAQCKGYASDDFVSTMKEVADDTAALIDLYAQG